MKRIYWLVIGLVVLFSCQQEQKNRQEMETKSKKDIVIENIMSRRSVRSYRPEQIKEEEMKEVMTCAINAPSAMNRQSWELRVVQKPELLKAINDGFVAYAKDKSMGGNASKSQEPGYSVFHGAPTLIVVANDTKNAYSQVDCGLLGQNILLAAESMDIGTCVVGGVIPFLRTPEAKDVIAQLNLPEGYEPLYTISMGYKNEHPDAKPRDAAKYQVIK